jgi:hypothetical protein
MSPTSSEFVKRVFIWVVIWAGYKAVRIVLV